MVSACWTFPRSILKRVIDAIRTSDRDVSGSTVRLPLDALPNNNPAQVVHISYVALSPSSIVWYLLNRREGIVFALTAGSWPYIQ